MSRYLILFILNIPFILVALTNVVVEYKLSRISKRKLTFSVIFWLVVLIGIASAKAIYQFLFSNQLTNTEPLSLFDVIQITGIVFLLFTTNRIRLKSEKLERRLNDLHQEISISLSSQKKDSST